MKNKIVVIFFVMAFITGNNRVYGEGAVYLEPLVYTPTRTQKLKGQSHSSVSVLTAEEIDRSPSVLLDDLLRSVPSVDIPFASSAVNHPTSQTFSMRGLGGKRALILIDGIPLNDPFGGWIPWSKVPKNNIEQIEVVRGGGSNLFGTYAMGGVVNIITKKPDKNELKIDTLFGSYSTQQHRVNLSNAGEIFKLNVNAEYFDTNGYRVVDPDIVGSVFTDANTENTTLQLNGYADVSDNVETKVRAQYFNSDQNPGTPLDKNSREIVDLAAGVDIKTNSAGQFKSNLFTQLQDFRTENAAITGVDSEFRGNLHKTPSTDVGGSVQWTKEINQFFPFFVAGTDYRHVKGEDEEIRLDSGGAATLVRQVEGKQQTFGLFSELSLVPVSPLEFLVSARLDQWENYDGSRTDSPGTKTNFSDESETEVSPRFSARYHPGGSWALRGAIFRSFRAPTLDELYRAFFSIGTTFDSNPMLGPEILKGGEVGVDFLKKSHDFQVTGFFNEITDSISLVFINPTLFQQQNIGKTRSVGVESIFSLRPHSLMTTSLSHVFTDATVRENSANTSIVGNRVPNVSKNVFIGTLVFDHPKIVLVSLRGRYLSNQFQTTSNTAPLGSHFILDISVSKVINEFIELKLMAENILGRHYLSSRFGGIRIRGAPIHVFGGVQLKWN